MRKILLVLVVLLASNLHAQKKSNVKSTFDYSKFEGLWYNENATTLFVWKEKNEYKAAEFSTYSGKPLDIIAFSMQDNRMYIESIFKPNSFYTLSEYTYLDNDTLSVIISGDADCVAIFTRYNYSTYNPAFLAATYPY